MTTRKSFTEIWKTDSKVRLLASGMMVDGALLIALVIAAGFIIAL